MSRRHQSRGSKTQYFIQQISNITYFNKVSIMTLKILLKAIVEYTMRNLHVAFRFDHQHNYY